MDWQTILSRLTVARLRKLAANAGLSGVSRKRKADLVEAVDGLLDDNLKRETLQLFSDEELGAVAGTVGVEIDGLRKPEILSTLLSDGPESEEGAEIELGDRDLLLADVGRLDVPYVMEHGTSVEPFPSRPTLRASERRRRPAGTCRR